MDIVIIGAGYAGMMTALRLDRTHNVTLINVGDAFVQRVRMHELAAGRPSVSIPLAELTRGTGIDVVTATVTGLDLDAKQVTTDDGRRFRYDTLVYALGSRTDVSVPGVAEHAYTAETAMNLRARLTGWEGRLLVVGGGLTGIEMAAELAESYPSWRVGLVTGAEPAAGLSAKGRTHVAKTLTRLGVTLHGGTRVRSVAPDGLRTDRGDLPADVVVWAGSFAALPLAAASGLTVDGRGRALVDPTLRSVSHPDVYAVGDAAAAQVPGAGTSRMSCAAGTPIGAHAADVINATAKGRPARRFRFRYFMQCVSLGRRDGVIQLVRHDDSPIGVIVKGRAGAWVKELVCRFTVASLRLERLRPGTYLWPKSPARLGTGSRPMLSETGSQR
ncbi:FAD-dependent oxidoreductase [Nonomuraea sp. NN258]|uniref:NAD(P)/FAD-dependent oxidoreductase n=1 Tax=Nonomuraea antri TaxID=2730852 RepID=UPI0015683B0C|nr:FAD-dependent oxidoreductase [Nonomuraea antri]NRQ40301.1 FAD-dependent oxidoreductase [Nonomuraea antri]